MIKRDGKKMTPKQQRYLSDRLDVAWREKFGWAARDPKVTPPLDVVAARKRIAKDTVIVGRWEKAQRAKKDKREASAKLLRRQVTEKILFGEPAVALEAVRKFEAL